MIKQWEILHYPSEQDSNRYRLSLWSDDQDVAKVRSIFPGRVGTVWVPHRKPYRAAFFIYAVTPEEKTKIEEILSGKTPFPEGPAPFLPVKPVDSRLTKEDTQEVVLIDAVAGDQDSVSTGIGGSPKGKSVIRLGYSVPEHIPNGGDIVQMILLRTLKEKKISVDVQKVFSLTYHSLSLSEIHRLLHKCQEQMVNRVIAIGDTGHMQALKKMGMESGVLILPLAESVLDKNLWLTMIAELISYE